MKSETGISEIRNAVTCSNCGVQMAKVHRIARSVLECGGWRGMGLTPLFLRPPAFVGKAVCALAPHPPHSKTLRDLRSMPQFGEHSCDD